ncbi:MAG: hypothetical protein IKC19_05090 [Bacteroidales bacterium]|nr:hypothetical protein [Bacteroidales bacterium]
MTDSYDDIINLPHHQSTHHRRMTIEERGALFSPFAALTGYDDTIDESTRIAIEDVMRSGAQQVFDPDIISFYSPDNIEGGL